MPITDFSNVTFSVEDGYLILQATARTTGQPYRHACPLASFETVACAVAEAGTEGVTRDALHASTGLAWTRINVALLFLYERGIAERAGRRGARYVPVAGTTYEDAMTEYHALAHGG